jgi:hypothetical protein
VFVVVTVDDDQLTEVYEGRFTAGKPLPILSGLLHIPLELVFEVLGFFPVPGLGSLTHEGPSDPRVPLIQFGSDNRL